MRVMQCQQAITPSSGFHRVSYQRFYKRCSLRRHALVFAAFAAELVTAGRMDDESFVEYSVDMELSDVETQSELLEREIVKTTALLEGIDAEHGSPPLNHSFAALDAKVETSGKSEAKLISATTQSVASKAVPSTSSPSTSPTATNSTTKPPAPPKLAPKDEKTIPTDKSAALSANARSAKHEESTVAQKSNKSTIPCETGTYKDRKMMERAEQRILLDKARRLRTKMVSEVEAISAHVGFARASTAARELNKTRHRLASMKLELKKAKNKLMTVQEAAMTSVAAARQAREMAEQARNAAFVEAEAQRASKEATLADVHAQVAKIRAESSVFVKEQHTRALSALTHAAKKAEGVALKSFEDTPANTVDSVISTGFAFGKKPTDPLVVAVDGGVDLSDEHTEERDSEIASIQKLRRSLENFSHAFA